MAEAEANSERDWEGRAAAEEGDLPTLSGSEKQRSKRWTPAGWGREDFDQRAE